MDTLSTADKEAPVKERIEVRERERERGGRLNVVSILRMQISSVSTSPDQSLTHYTHAFRNKFTLRDVDCRSLELLSCCACFQDACSQSGGEQVHFVCSIFFVVVC